MIKCFVEVIKNSVNFNNPAKLFVKCCKMEAASNNFKSNGPENKLARKDLKIGTHNGVFHCDEVLACCLLQHLPEFSTASIVRTRDPDTLKKCDIVVDVGGVYDPSTQKFDHHQRSFQETMHSLKKDYPWVTKLSSAGLVYFHFGHRIISSILKYSADSKETEILFRKLYENLIEEVDAIDNGVDLFDGITPRYRISTHLSSRVKRLNPPWNNESMNENLSFEMAKKMVNDSFMETLTHYNNVWLPAREIVLEAIKTRYTVHCNGEIIEFVNGTCPWKEHLFQLEEELNIEPKIKFAIYRDSNKNWRVQCVPASRDSFENRLSLKQEWCGIRDEELSKISGIPDCIFVHANGFIGGNKTRDGALKMAKKTLNIVDC